jgi:hypothetical protein
MHRHLGTPPDPIARQTIAAPHLLAAAQKINRLALVIESAIRRADDGNYYAVLDALKAIEAAIVKAEETP